MLLYVRFIYLYIFSLLFTYIEIVNSCDENQMNAMNDLMRVRAMKVFSVQLNFNMPNTLILAYGCVWMCVWCVFWMRACMFYFAYFLYYVAWIWLEFDFNRKNIRPFRSYCYRQGQAFLVVCVSYLCCCWWCWVITYMGIIYECSTNQLISTDATLSCIRRIA